MVVYAAIAPSANSPGRFSMPKLVLNIPRVPKSPNALRGRHWTVKHKDRNDWLKHVTVATLLQGWKPGPLFPKPFKRAVKIEVHSAARFMDPDNLQASRKPILDSLVEMGVLYDDAAEYCESTITQHKSTRKDARTIIEISDL
jgi:hypothetical protein